ncbi:MAG: hypothetical protein M3441_04260 [Chloroflexota bacterium]|nr:hypothetical protein [Chloroflexota bacterium]
MQDKFDIYDLLGYIIPGALALGLLYWFSTGFLALTWPLELNSLGESLVLIVVGYFFGQIVQAVGHKLSRRYIEKWGGYFSQQFVHPDNTTFSAEFKKQVQQCAEEAFGIPYAPPDANEKIQVAQRQEIYQLCYTLVMAEKLGQRAQLFIGTYGLYRGLIVVGWMGVAVSAAIALKQITICLLLARNVSAPYLGLPGDRFWGYDELQLFLGVVALPFFALAIPLLKERLKTFAEHYAAEVYRTFYVWCQTKRRSTP